jgi:hypothetical protein
MSNNAALRARRTPDAPRHHSGPITLLMQESCSVRRVIKLHQSFSSRGPSKTPIPDKLHVASPLHALLNRHLIVGAILAGSAHMSRLDSKHISAALLGLTVIADADHS